MKQLAEIIKMDEVLMEQAERASSPGIKSQQISKFQF